MAKRFSMRAYLTRHLVVWSLIMTSLPAILVYYNTLHEVDELFDASLVQTAKVLNGLISREAVNQNRQHLINSLLAKDSKLVLNKHHPYEKKLYFQVWDANGLVVKSSQAPDIAFGHMEEGFHVIEAGGHTWLSFAIFSEHDDWWLVVGERHDIRSELVFDIVKSHVLPITIFIPLLLLIVSYVLRRGFSPLNQVRKEITRQKYKQLEQIDSSRSPEEVALLVASLNELLSRLKKAYTKESRFVSDVAHELRTPLSGLLIHTENLIDDAQDHALVSDLLAMKRSILRLSHLVNQLLAASRSTINLDQKSLIPIDMQPLIQGVLESTEDLRESKQQTIETEIDDVAVLGLDSLINGLVRNVIDNALRYTPEGGRIGIYCHQIHEGEVELIIQDSGPGIPESMRESAKERFTRLHSEDTEGSGLGLSIVDNVVGQLKIEWSLTGSQWGGLNHRFVFKLKA